MIVEVIVAGTVDAGNERAEPLVTENFVELSGCFHLSITTRMKETKVCECSFHTLLCVLLTVQGQLTARRSERVRDGASVATYNGRQVKQ